MKNDLEKRMSKINRFEDLEVWQRARGLAAQIYRLSDAGAFSKDYGLKDQMRRAVISILSNIAEGFESRTNLLFIEYLGRAKASFGELRAQLYIALDLGYITENDFQHVRSEAEVCTRQLASFITYLKSKADSYKIRDNEEVYNAE